MKTIGLPLYPTIPATDEAPILQKVCQKYTGNVMIRIRDIELDPRKQPGIAELSNHGGEFMQIVAEGPDEGDLAAAIHQQLAKDKYCY
ncbi:PTS sugar transporter [Levilactobacillus suantsaii]|uniref:PTS sugar transporter n=1 Tax=Levilactobacillus suantsaii TaxID=2292255 RepID=A0A4Q0VKY8_9LACO|nr:PTS sugar transporter [Levilactobacillus suantsaii]RXI79086.1 PTS sugar transporter [Levilactobacillus suantsaii]